MSKAMAAAPRTLFRKLWDNHHVVTDEGESLLYIDRALAQENTYHAFVALEAQGRQVMRPDQIYAFTDHYVPTTGRAKGLAGIPVIEIRNMVVQLQDFARSTASTCTASTMRNRASCISCRPSWASCSQGWR